MLDLTSPIFMVEELLEDTSIKYMRHPILPSRINEDLQHIREEIGDSLQKLKADEIAPLFVLALFLKGYDILEELENNGQLLWRIQSVDPSSIPNMGVGVFLEHLEQLNFYLELVHDGQYAFCVFCLPQKSLMPEELLIDRVSVFDQVGLRNLLMALATNRYVDTYAFTISAIPGLRQRVHQAIIEETGLNWEIIVNINKRWRTLLH